MIVGEPKRRSGFEIKVDGRVYEADSLFNLRNLILTRRNAFAEAALLVERMMEELNDPMLAHLSKRS